MRKFILLIASVTLFYGCSSIPSDPSSFGPDSIGSVHYDAEDLGFEEASYLFMGKGNKSLLMLSGIDTEIYTEAFGTKEKSIASGLYNEYVKLKPGVHDLEITSRPQGVQMGNTMIISIIELTYEFSPGYVYVLNKEESDSIDVSFWKIGSQEMFEDKVELSESRG